MEGLSLLAAAAIALLAGAVARDALGMSPPHSAVECAQRGRLRYGGRRRRPVAPAREVSTRPANVNRTIDLPFICAFQVTLS